MANRFMSCLTSTLSPIIFFWSWLKVVFTIVTKMSQTLRMIRNLPSMVELLSVQTRLGKLEEKIVSLEKQLSSSECRCCSSASQTCKINTKTIIGLASPPPPPPPPPPVNVRSFKFVQTSTPVFLGNGRNNANLLQAEIIEQNGEFLKRKRQKPLQKEDLIEQKKMLRKISCPPRHFKCDSNPFEPRNGEDLQQVEDLNDLLRVALKRKFEGVHLNESTFSEDNTTDFSI